MSTEENKAIVRRVFEAINEKNWAVLDDVFSTDCIFHGPWGEEKVTQLIKRVALMMYDAFPDHHFTIEDMIVEGNKVVTRATVQGTHKNDFMGIAPTGKQFTMTGIWIYYIADGKIIEDWEVLDQLGMMQQLGAIPPMGQ